MTAWGLMDAAARLGVTLKANGNLLQINGPAEARAALRPLLKAHKHEILALLRAAEQGGRQVMPCDGPGHEWHRDYLGRPVNLAGLRKPEEGCGSYPGNVEETKVAHA